MIAQQIFGNPERKARIDAYNASIVRDRAILIAEITALRPAIPPARLNEIGASKGNLELTRIRDLAREITKLEQP